LCSPTVRGQTFACKMSDDIDFKLKLEDDEKDKKESTSKESPSQKGVGKLIDNQRLMYD
jgi:hypothetical protein